jgi:hypothetical protein
MVHFLMTSQVIHLKSLGILQLFTNLFFFIFLF